MSAISKLRTNELAAILEKVAMDDAQQLQAACRAADIDSADEGRKLLKLTDQELAQIGWKRRDLRIAIDAKECSKVAPYYLKMLSDRTNLRWRDGEGEKQSKAAKFIMPVLVVNQNGRDNAPVIEVGGDGEVKR